MKVFLVTGGLGFIGSALIRLLLKQPGHVVVNVDCQTYAGRPETLGDVSHNPFYFHECVDIRNYPALTNVFARYRPDAVMHLAAESHVDRSIDDARIFIDTNVVGTLNLLEAARHYFNELTTELQDSFRFHHVSTDEVFGDLGPGNELFSELSAYAPSSPYSASKAASDHLVAAWSRTYRLPTLITHCSNNYGPYQFPEKLIPQVIVKALSGELIPVYGDGLQVRDWLYVEDHAIALYTVVTQAKPGNTFNIGGHNEKKNIEVIKKICELLEELVPVKPLGVSAFSDLISFVPDRPGHDARYAIDSTKIHEHLNWSPQETFESGLRKTVIWFLRNKSWWKQLLPQDSKKRRDIDNEKI